MAHKHIEKAIAGKLILLLFLILSVIALAAGYLILAKMIAAGEIQIAEGQKQLERGQSAIEEGKTVLDAGKRKLSEGKEDFAQAENNLFLVLADKLLKGGMGFEEGRERIAAGSRRVAKGEREVNVGERRLGAGDLELSEGREQLKEARKARGACAIGGVVLALLAIVFGFRWRRILVGFVVQAVA